jgi:hypothetical protein
MSISRSLRREHRDVMCAIGGERTSQFVDAITNELQEPAPDTQ